MLIKFVVYFKVIKIQNIFYTKYVRLHLVNDIKEWVTCNLTFNFKHWQNVNLNVNFLGNQALVDNTFQHIVFSCT